MAKVDFTLNVAGKDLQFTMQLGFSWDRTSDKDITLSISTHEFRPPWKLSIPVVAREGDLSNCFASVSLMQGSNKRMGYAEGDIGGFDPQTGAPSPEAVSALEELINSALSRIMGKVPLDDLLLEEGVSLQQVKLLKEMIHRLSVKS